MPGLDPKSLGQDVQKIVTDSQSENAIRPVRSSPKPT